VLERYSIGLRRFVHGIKAVEFPGMATGNLKKNFGVLQVFLREITYQQ